jgi:hypothetical protein
MTPHAEFKLRVDSELHQLVHEAIDAALNDPSQMQAIAGRDGEFFVRVTDDLRAVLRKDGEAFLLVTIV